VNKEELISQVRTPAPQIKIAEVLWVVAIMVIMAAAIIWVVLAVMTGDYFTSSKAARDAAQAGSPILAQQQTIEVVKDWVLPFAFVGLATFLLGFGFGFANILRNIRLRGQTMAVALPELKQRKSGD
jgi:heme/copper-type cytochrome/quinol oxidase subunit 2